MRFDLSDSAALTWRKSSYSGNGANCVEVMADTDLRYMVRDTKDRQGPVLVFTPGEWAAFTASVKAGEFDPRLIDSST